MEQDHSDDNNFQAMEETTTSGKNETNDGNVETTVNWGAIKSVGDFLRVPDTGDFDLDRNYGVRKDQDGTLKIGSELIDFMDGKIFVKEKPYSETPGLLQLLFRRKPDETLITNDDVKNFHSIAEEKNLLKKDYEPVVVKKRQNF